MPLRLNHKFFKFIRFLALILLWLAFSADLFALPIRTSILNPEKQVVGQALVYIDYVELLKQDGTPLGRLGFVNIQGGFQMFVVRDDGKQSLVGSAKNRRLYDKICANFVPLAYKNRPYLGICGNSEDQSTC